MRNNLKFECVKIATTHFQRKRLYVRHAGPKQKAHL